MPTQSNNNPQTDLQKYKAVKKELIELRALGTAITEEQKSQLDKLEKQARILGKTVKAQQQFAKTLKGNLSDFEDMDDTMVSIGNQIGKNTKLAEQTSKSFTKVKLVAASIVAELASGGTTNEKTERQVEAAVGAYKNMHTSIAQANKQYALGNITAEERNKLIEDEAEKYKDIAGGIDMANVSSEELRKQ
jgi:hypothetical protein